MNIKEKIRESNFRQWEIAEAMGISEFTLSRWLRRPENLSNDKTRVIEATIEELKRSASEEKRGDEQRKYVMK